MRIRATHDEGMTIVKVLVNHPMETGRREGPEGTYPAHFITELTARHNDRVVLAAQFGRSVSRNPFMKFTFRGGVPGDKVSIHWVDNLGDSRADEVEIK